MIGFPGLNGAKDGAWYSSSSTFRVCMATRSDIGGADFMLQVAAVLDAIIAAWSSCIDCMQIISASGG